MAHPEFLYPVAALVMLTFFTTQALSPVLLGLAWSYVALRAWHSFVHLGYNKVLIRFKIFLASSVVLGVMWAVAVEHLVG
jgi:hypothetical protein